MHLCHVSDSLPLNIKIMNNQKPLNNNRDELESAPEQKNPNPVNIESFLEEGKLQKRFFSGQITVEEYHRKKRCWKCYRTNKLRKN